MMQTKCNINDQFENKIKFKGLHV